MHNRFMLELIETRVAGSREPPDVSGLVVWQNRVEGNSPLNVDNFLLSHFQLIRSNCA